jgi:hypothetical protein
VNEHEDQLRTAFETHEHLAPDAAAVYSRVQELSRSYQRRRWGVQAAGGAVLGVSLIAGAISLPGLLPGQQQGSVNVGAATMPNMTPSAPASPAEAEAEQEKLRSAYFDAGYDYDDAVQLAKIWESKDDISAIKAEAGRRLLAGERLPIRATPNDPASPGDSAPPSSEISPLEQKRINAFFLAGYGYEDAAKLAKLWKLSLPYEAKIEGGKRLLADKKLPIKPSAPAAAKEEAHVNAFYEAGFDYDDAVTLAKLWKLSDPYRAKVEGGKRILDGDTLPIKP